MTYVFYETGNDKFFQRILNKFCCLFFEYFLYLLKDEAEKERLFPDGKTLNMIYLKEVCDKRKKYLTTLSCNLFSFFAHCAENEKCKEDHDKNDYKVVLASDQAEKCEKSMSDNIKKLNNKRHVVKDKYVRMNFQRMLQNSQVASGQNIVHMKIFFDANPCDFKKGNPDSYKELYLKEAKRIADKTDENGIEEFVYVCARTNTEYNYFKASIKSTGVPVKACHRYKAV